MKLSIVIPVYNGADFIWKSYDSIINQDVKDFEILYVDNNSEDTSVEKIQEVISKDHRVKLFKQSRQGSAPARNKGIENAIGDYVYFFDVDDEIYSGALQKMITVLDTHTDVDAVFGKMIKSYKGISETGKPDDETNEVTLKDKPYWGIFWFSNLKHVVGPPAFLYRRQVFETIGIYNEKLRIGQDTALDIKLGMMCNVAFINTYIYLYFKHSTSTIEKAKKKKDKIALHWSRYVNSHLPFYLENDVPIRYKQLLYDYLYSTTAKRICNTKGFVNRKQLLKDINTEIEPVKFPLILRIFLWIMTILPLTIILKLYLYYISPYYIRNHIKKL